MSIIDLPARRIDGTAFAARFHAKVAAGTAALKAEHGLTPGPMLVRMG